VRILVMGAGVVGGYFGSALPRGGEDVTLVTRGQHLETIKRNGLVVRSYKGNFKLRPLTTDNPSGLEDFDVVLISAKSYDIDTAIRTIERNIGERTIVLSASRTMSRMTDCWQALTKRSQSSGLSLT
jgi:2-dehydropantoate 2-reductase